MPIEISVIYPLLDMLWQILKEWWWLLLLFLFWKPFLFLYLWWRIDRFISQQQMVLLEIKLPKEMEKPIRAMEVVFSSLHASIYQPPGDLWEKWIDGQVQLSLGLEIASIDGEPHFFVRTPFQYREAVEASLYSQYSEIEIQEADDYTKHVPQNIPNKEWDLFGCAYKMVKDDHYPIKTYAEFETEQEKEVERIIDPIASLLEGMNKIKKGEQLWVQFLIEPVGDADIDKSFSKWQKKGEALKDKLARRPSEKSQAYKPMAEEAFEVLIMGKTEEPKKEEKDLFPPEMRLTPGERDALYAVEKKMAKPVFQTTVRFIYLGKKDVWFKPNFRLAFSFFNQYATNNFNALFPDGKTITKIKKAFFFQFFNLSIIRNRRHYLRCRKLFRNYIKRLSPFFPKSGGTYMLNTEEIASLYHFPGEGAAPAPGMIRIGTKKRGVPPGLPVE